MAVNDRYEVTINYDHVGGEAAASVFHYLQTQAGDPSHGATELAFAANVHVWQHIRAQMDDGWSCQNIYAVNLDDPGDFFDLLIEETGELTATALPTVVVVEFRSPRKVVGVNRAYKRLPLGNAEQLGGGGQIASSSIDSFYFIQQALGTPIASLGSEWTPVILRKNYVDSVLVSVIVRAEVTGQWELNRSLGTQKSRQEYDWVVADEPQP